MGQAHLDEVGGANLLAEAHERGVINVAGAGREQDVLGRDAVHPNALATVRQRCRTGQQAIRPRRQVQLQLLPASLGLGHHHGHGVLRDALDRDFLLVRHLVQIDGRAARPVHQRVLDEVVQDAEAVILAHQDMRDVSRRLAGELLLTRRLRHELNRLIRTGEYPHHRRHDAFDDILKLGRYDLRGTFLLVAVGFARVVVERLYAVFLQRRGLEQDSRLLLLSQNLQQVVVRQRLVVLVLAACCVVVKHKPPPSD